MFEGLIAKNSDAWESKGAVHQILTLPMTTSSAWSCLQLSHARSYWIDRRLKINYHLRYSHQLLQTLLQVLDIFWNMPNFVNTCFLDRQVCRRLGWYINECTISISHENCSFCLGIKNKGNKKQWICKRECKQRTETERTAL